MLTSLPIVLLGLVAAVGYGIVHDNVTARVCVEYFTIGHPPVFGPTTDPTILAFGWGVIATWWVGVPLVILLALVSRLGPAPKLTARDLLRPLAVQLLVMGLLATSAGFAGYYAAGRGWVFLTGDLAGAVPLAKHRAFLADLWAHLMSYASAVVGALVLAVWVGLRRRRLATERSLSPAVGV